jgi:hypothetical protein
VITSAFGVDRTAQGGQSSEQPLGVGPRGLEVDAKATVLLALALKPGNALA